MPKMLIELSNEDAAKLRDLAEQNGSKVKPFVEFLVRVQIGSLPPPTLQPVHFNPVQDTVERSPRPEILTKATTLPEQPEEDRKEEEPQPERMRPDVAAHRDLLKPSTQAAPKQQPKPWTPNKNLSAYTEETDTGSGIFTDGKSFAIQTGPVGRQKAYFFEDLVEAEEFTAEQREAF